MQFQEGHSCHIYNRGNNRQPIFFNTNNYLFFLQKIRHFIKPYCNILNYSLMPNHFHMMVHMHKSYTGLKHPLIGGISSLLSSYAQAINKQNKTSGSLFQQKTKTKSLTDGLVDYSRTCFHYIHQNPMRVGIVKRMEDWTFSSFCDYAGFRTGTLCDKDLAFKLLDLDAHTFYSDSYDAIDNRFLDNIF